MARTRSRTEKPGRTLGKVARAKKRVDSKMSGGKKFLTIEDGETVVMRFLEEGEDFKDAYVHNTPFERDDGSTYYLDVPCLDQDEKGVPCPGCRDELDIRYKFYVCAIVRDYPEVDDNGKVLDEKDQVVVWTGGVKVGDKLAKKHSRYGLMSRDWEITRDGVKLKTEYEIEPAGDGAEPMSKEDKQLAETKPDLTFYVKPPEFEEFYVSPKDRGDAKAVEEGKKANPWGERKKSGGKTKAKFRSSRSSGEDGETKVRSGRKRSKGTTKVRRRR